MKSILLIDDDQAIREGIKELLATQWPNVLIFEAENGARGVEMAILKRPSLIILDGNMPIMTGYQMVMLLRQMETVAETPILSLTAADPENPAIRLMIDGSDDYLRKPFNPDTFLQVVGRFLV